MTTVILFLVILSVLVFVHELGHFLLAKWAKVRVDEFAIGFPPKIFSWKPKNHETTYALNLIPFGGYVKIYGENPEDAGVNESDRSFVRKSKWWQVAILAAGVSFNILFAWMVISLGLMVGLPTASSDYAQYPLKDSHLAITSVLPESPAAKAGLKIGDSIVFAEANGKTIQGDMLEPLAVQEVISESAGKELTFLVSRKGENVSLKVIPEEGILEGRFAIGIAMDTVGILKLPIHLSIWEGAKITVSMTKLIAVGTVGFIKDAFTGSANLAAVSGPVGMAGMVGDARSLGFAYLLSFTALISMNLAVLNLLPFPALDGGRILFVIIEAIKRSPIKPKIANAVNLAGFSILILLMAVITIREVWGLIVR